MIGGGFSRPRKVFAQFDIVMTAESKDVSVGRRYSGIHSKTNKKSAMLYVKDIH